VGEKRQSAGEWLARRIVASGLTNSDLAKIAGVSRRTIDKIVRDRTMPSRATLTLLAPVLGFSLAIADWLHEGNVDVRELDALCTPVAPARGWTGEDLYRWLGSLTPAERGRTIRSKTSGMILLRAEVGTDSLLFEGRKVF
jgi:transcriptional regulator with XRE-family HTH domain